MTTKTNSTPTASHNILAEKAVICSLRISQWAARRFDRAVTEDTNKRHNADVDAGRYNKMLVEKSDLEAIFHHSGAARSKHAEWTLPWFNDGSRILPAASYLDFTREIRAIRIDFEDAAATFCRDYPAMIDKARSRLNGMFNREDYPDPHEIHKLFSFDIRFMDVPTGDFRCDIADSHLEAMREDVETKLKEALNIAMKDTRDRIIKTVGAMAERLNAYTGKADGSFKNSLVENVRDLAGLLPAFNLTNDPKLNDIIKRIDAKLCKADADELRKNGDLRDTVRRDAERILTDVQSFMA